MTALMRSLREQSVREMDAVLTRIGREEPAKRLSLVMRRVGLDLLDRIIRRTPVDTGRARGNWQVSLGSPAGGVLEVNDKGGQDARRRGKAVLDAYVAFGGNPYTVIWLSNNLPYVVVLEEGGYPNPSKKELGASAAAYAGASSGVARKTKAQRNKLAAARPRTRGGFSLQAPAGMVAISLQEVLAQFRRHVTEAAQEKSPPTA